MILKKGNCRITAEIVITKKRLIKEFGVLEHE